MKTVSWDSGFTWDDPNLRWGDPSYQLEPGDPGYVPPPAPTPPVTQKPKQNRMAKSDYLNTNDDLFAAQMQTFKTGIGGYAAQLGVTPAQVASQAADADYFRYVVASQGIMQGGAQQWTSWKNLLRASGSTPAGGTPLPPVFPASVPAVTPGVEVRFRALVKQIKANANYVDAIGQVLGIEGAQTTGPDLTTLQPVLDATLSGNVVQLGWGWGGNSAYLDMLEIQVDRGQGWALLAFDTTPNYTDTTALPATATKWKYRAIYHVGDHPVGQWSAEVSVTVGG